MRILDEVLKDAARGGVAGVPPLKATVDKKLGKTVALSTLYRMLARNGWRKLAPDTAHSQGDAALREDWKKTPGELVQAVTAWGNHRPLRLMFQDDTRYCWRHKPARPLVSAMVAQQYTYAYGAGWHRSSAFRLPDNLRLLFLPPYSPELNPPQHLWDELREKYFHNRVFESLDTLEDHLTVALRNLENAPDRVKSITGWGWIINAISNGN